MTAGKKPRQISKEVLYSKAMKYCSYAERCTYDATSKLRHLGAGPELIQEIIEKLTSQGYINDSRFSKLFAESKLRHNRWGKHKIKAELLRRNIDNNSIEQALSAIDDDEYMQCLRSLFSKKAAELTTKNKGKVTERVINFCIRKGWEPELVLTLNAE